MSLENCTYYGTIGTKYQSDLKNNSVFVVKQEQDLTELAKNILIHEESQKNITAKIDLKDRNIVFIYNVLPGSGQDYRIKSIHTTPTVIQVKVAALSCPGLGGTCDMNAELFVLSAPKKYEKEHLKVSREKLDIFSEPEFEGFEYYTSLGNNIDKAFLTLGEDVQFFTSDAYYHQSSDETISKESWFTALNEKQKEIVMQFRAAVIARDKALEEKGDDYISENSSECYSRYRQLLRGMEERLPH
jgi:hypothetical protein